MATQLRKLGNASFHFLSGFKLAISAINTSIKYFSRAQKNIPGKDIPSLASPLQSITQRSTVNTSSINYIKNLRFFYITIDIS
ncbi:hypothetical protein BOTCAL_0047g00370 [Botryotinia calthae]|uniref:Uncharacterized protein n=1 Tax=Botryotinia calthae TaxID=38488 RepID=A0A4Y8DBT5_9HELO|nr:hypothetical protein BOTCAL_0047g00370 [Botryotinia calthae]